MSMNIARFTNDINGNHKRQMSGMFERTIRSMDSTEALNDERVKEKNIIAVENKEVSKKWNWSMWFISRK